MDVVAPGNLPHGLAVLLATKNLLPLVRGEFGLVANLHPTRLRPLQTARARRSLSIRRFLRGEDAMVGHRAKWLMQRNREPQAQITRMRLEAKEQAREEWLERAKAQAARIANRPASNIPQKAPGRRCIALIESGVNWRWEGVARRPSRHPSARHQPSLSR
jgi:hypothetical protein